MAASLLRAATGISAAADPLEAEILASEILATLEEPVARATEGVPYLCGTLIRGLVTKRTPDALAMLHALAAIAPDATAAVAR